MRAVPITVALLLALASAAFGQESDDYYFKRVAGDTVQILPGELFAAERADHGLPELGYENGGQWQALVCAETCSLVTVELRITPMQVYSYGGVKPLDGQTIALDREVDGLLVAVLRGLPPTVGGTIATRLHAGMSRYPSASTPSTLEIPIPGQPHDPLRIVPRRARGEPANEQPLNVYLETNARRQLLGQLWIDTIVGYAGFARGTSLLRWAGDLDGDGKVDLIMSFNTRVGELMAASLFLSTAATGDELVRQVANFSYFPIENPGD